MGEIEAICKQTSSKEVKSRTADQVKFDFKEKGKKPVVTKGILQVTFTGGDFNVDKLVEGFKAQHATELD